jgi:alkanesulfonate monooxygenase SsuD/methylene tetrahydromethanopterin reductase-like flavin-dependent oxidoreductase (luciferase family)
MTTPAPAGGTAPGATADARPARRPLKFGLLLPHGEGGLDGTTPRWADLLALARRAEAVGFDSLWVVDHFLVRPAAVAAQSGVPVTPELAAAAPLGVWEGWSLLAALAAATGRVELGTLVACTGYRNPALLAKMAATVDEIGGGRLILGLGAGDYEDEHRSFGFRWDRRVGRFEEALAIVAGLLRDGRVDFAGEYYAAPDCKLRPRGPRPNSPPLLIGALAHGPRVLRLVAQYADLWNGWLTDGRSHPDAVPPLRAAVDAACAAVGRDPATLGRTVAVRAMLLGRAAFPGEEPLSGTPAELAESLRAFPREGIAQVQVWPIPNTLAGVEAFAPVLELLDRG